MFFNDIHIRIRFSFLVVCICFALIIGKVFYIQVFSYNKLSKITEDLWSRKMTINAPRGDIVDRNGVVLATSIVTTTIYVVPNQIEDKEKVSRDISEILDCKYNDVYKYVSNNSSMEIIRKGMDIDSDVADKIEALGYDGVYLVVDSKRYYPYGDVLAHIIGFVGSDNQGLSGLELTYDDYLKGTNGELKYYSDGKGNKLEIPDSYVEPTKGMTLKLTLDIELIKAVDNEINNAISKYNANAAIAIAMIPDTGEILAMGSKPSFDPENYQDYSKEVINRNLPIWMTFEPGSTFKIITLASSVEEGTVDLFKDTFTDTGSVNVDGSTLHCWKHGGHGTQTYLQVVENSCNTGFVSLGNKLGKEKLMNYITKFGFGSKTGIDLNGEGNGILFKTKNMGPVELATTAFGQGISVTPIQQITAVSAAINGGYLNTPYVVDSIISDTNEIVYSNKKKTKRKVISDKTSATVRYALESVVSNGTGKNAYIENYRVGGKTGTAQKVNEGRYMQGNYILSFIGFLPADKPEVIVYVAVDNPKGVTQYGGTVSAPIARNILLSSINTLGIKEKNGGMLKEYTWLDTKYIVVPNVIGMNKKEATQNLKEFFEVKYSGTGDTVVYQSPSPNKFQSVDSTITLMLN